MAIENGKKSIRPIIYLILMAHLFDLFDKKYLYYHFQNAESDFEIFSMYFYTYKASKEP